MIYGVIYMKDVEQIVSKYEASFSQWVISSKTELNRTQK